MAERRMFTKKVTDDDNFMSLSASAQALYLHLSMSADDDGFCNQVTVSMFKAHASIQDLEALLTKRYVYQFENGVIVIKHWRMANALRKDRYTPTAFQEELKQLELKENGAYTFANNDVVAERLPSGCQVVATGKDSIDKDSIGKSSKDKSNTARKLADEFEILWAIYPKKQGKKKALDSYVKARKKGTTYEEVKEGIFAYAKYIRATNTEERFIKHGSTFFNQQSWQDDWTVDRGYSFSSGKTEESFEDMIARL